MRFIVRGPVYDYVLYIPNLQCEISGAKFVKKSSKFTLTLMKEDITGQWFKLTTTSGYH